jgi:hypothetical protein
MPLAIEALIPAVLVFVFVLVGLCLWSRSARYTPPNAFRLGLALHIRATTRQERAHR